jgi:hypothetical protein
MLFLAIKIFLTLAIADGASIAFHTHAKLAFACGLLVGVIVQNLVPPSVDKKRTGVLLIVVVAFGVVRVFVH